MLSLRKKDKQTEIKTVELKRDMVVIINDRLYEIKSIEPDNNLNVNLFCVRIK